MEVVIGLTIALFIILFFMRGKRVSSDDAKKMVADGALLVDVRSSGEFGSGHLDGAKNIPVDEVSRRLEEFGEKSATIVLYCRSGARSGAALRTLKGAGFTNVHNLGPMTAW